MKNLAQVNIGSEFGFGDITTLGEGLSRLVNPAFSVAAVLVLMYFLYGSFKILTSSGDKEAVAAGREAIIHAIIGFVLLMAAFLVLNSIVYELFGIRDVPLIKGLL